MPIRYDGNTIYFEETCQIDEVEQLFNTLLTQKNVQFQADLSKCTYMHTAVFQMLLASKMTILNKPDSEFLKQCLSNLA